jgi:glycosyltransferase involved in cell wall biosynthesis
VKVVVGTCDALAPKMAGPAIRAWQIAAALSSEHEVRLVSTTIADLSDPRFSIEAVDDAGLEELERWCDVFVFQGWLIHARPFLLSSTKVIVADLYDPLHLEQLEQGRDEGRRGRRQAVRSATAVLNEQLIRGDFFLCASERQRDFWLGQMAAVGRVNPRTYDEDRTLRSLLAVVPFGVPDQAPVRTGAAMRGVVPGIGADDKIVLWGGGIYNWFDPLTLLHAVDRVRRRVPTLRLLFMGLKHPNPDIPEMAMAVATRELSDRLGLTGSHVYFNEGWVDYEDRQNYLLEADVEVSTHLDGLESALSFRTRILDYLWASLPVVATAGDALADIVVSSGAGTSVPAGDVDALADALVTILEDDDLRERHATCASAAAVHLRWSQVLEPLVSFCRAPRRAPDLLDPALVGAMRTELAVVPPVPRSFREDVRALQDHLDAGGSRLVVAKAAGRLRRLWS